VHSYTVSNIVCMAHWLERRSLAGRLFLIYD